MVAIDPTCKDATGLVVPIPTLPSPLQVIMSLAQPLTPEPKLIELPVAPNPVKLAFNTNSSSAASLNFTTVVPVTVDIYGKLKTPLTSSLDIGAVVPIPTLPELLLYISLPLTVQLLAPPDPGILLPKTFTISPEASVPSMYVGVPTLFAAS